MSCDDPWEKLLEDREFRQSIDKKGYYSSSISFSSYARQYHLALKGKAPDYLSKDFWSEQSPTLRSQKLYVIRTGRGHFSVFREDRFAKPYLDLGIDKNIQEIPAKAIEGYDHLKTAFKHHNQEDSNLELLHILGIYDELAQRLCKKTNYKVGPRGGRSSTFKFYMHDKENPRYPVAFEYSGQEELDYTIWTEDSVLAFEAKQVSDKSGLDIGWHKLAFPLDRFREMAGLKIFPIYYLRVQDDLYFFAFPQFQFFNGGTMLNDAAIFKPTNVFRVDLSTV